MMTSSCDKCTVYESTTKYADGYIAFEVCHSCLIEMRATLKALFKVSEASRAELKRREER